MKAPLFTGVCTAMVTPFIHGQVNYPMMDVLLQRQMKAGIPAVVISGTTGEAPTLSDEEKITLFRRCKNYVGGQMQIIAGTGSNSTDHAVALSIAAQDAGADALLVVSPYYNKANADGLYSHYKAIHDAVNIPVILYNVPSRTGLDTPVEVYQQLSLLPRIAGIKEASTSIKKIARIRQQCDIQIWSGNDDMTIPVISLGGQGVISVMSNVLPSQMVLMTEAALAGDFDTAANLHISMLDIMDALFCDVNPIPVKSAMRLIGYDCGPCRMPLSSLAKEKQEKLKQLLQ